MADKAVVTQTTLDAIGQAIIDKGGATEAMTPAQMPAAILAIPSGEELPLYAPAIFPDEKMTPPEWFEDGKVHLWVDFGLNPSADTIGLLIGANSVGCVEVDWGDGTVETNTEVGGYGIKMSHVFDKYANGNEFVITISLKNGVTATRYGYANTPFVNVGGECTWAVEITYNGGDQGGSVDLYNDTSICLFSGLRYLKVSGDYFRGAFITGKTTLIRDIITNVYTGTRNANFISGLPITRKPDWLEFRGTLGYNSFASCRNLQKLDESDFRDIAFTNCYAMFSNCNSLIRVPDTLDLSACTNCSNMFSNCLSLVALPTHVTAIRGLSFANSSLVSKDSVATFDENGNVVGGFVGNLNTKPSDAGTQIMNFHANTKALFTDDEWTAVKTCLTDKGWAVTPA